MSAVTDDQTQSRSLVLICIVLGLAALAVGRLVYLLLKPLPWSPPPGPSVQETYRPDRGNIYDCNGYLLAAAYTFADIGVSPNMITNTIVFAERLAPLLGWPKEKLLTQLDSAEPYVGLERRVSWERARQIDDLELSGLKVKPWPGRLYPHGPLGSCLLGFVNDEGDAFYGVELKYDQLLRGSSGSRTAQRDPLGSLFYEVKVPHHGANLFLTIDRRSQSIVEEVLSRAVEDNAARRGTVIVMDPRTGAILAMAVYPTYDPNIRDVEDFGVFINAAISEHYEPGSVFKIVTVAAALDAGTISPTDSYYDEGWIMVGGERIENSDHAAHGETVIRDLLAYSRNVGAAHVSTQLGASSFYDYLRRFGFNSVTGVDLAGEVAGSVRFPGDREWHESDLGTNSFGQGLAVTPLQMLCAVSAVANHGLLMRPHVVGRIVDNGVETHVAPEPVRQVVSSKAADQVTEMLVYAVDTVLRQASVPGYKVAGKSGTSQVPTLSGYDPEETIASFAGYLPADDPSLAVLVVLDRPQKEHWGLMAAAPAFREIAERLLASHLVAEGRGTAAPGVQ